MRAISTPSRPPRHAPPTRNGCAARLLRGRPGDPSWARPALLGLQAVEPPFPDVRGFAHVPGEQAAPGA